MMETPQYWDEVAGRWQSGEHERAWRVVSDRVNLDLLARWAPGPYGRVLKTDLFDEVASTGLVPHLLERSAYVAGIDISPALVDMARARLPRLDARVADVRHLPFAESSFDTILSNSTLDHFPARAHIVAAITELHRVLRPGGTMIITLDNPINPAVAIRNALPDGVRRLTRLSPFAVGATCGHADLRAMLAQTGFDVLDVRALFHAPRALVVLGGHAVDRFAGAAGRRGYARIWTAFEVLDRLPTRFLTGHFVAALARKT